MIATQFLSPCSSPFGDQVSKGIKHKVAALYSNEVREELLSNQTMKQNLNDPIDKATESNNMLSTLRQRKSELLNTGKPSAPARDFDAVMKHEQETHEQLSETLHYLTKSLKEQASTSNVLIRKDINTLQKSNNLAEENQTNLQSHSQKLRERTGFCARCWVWACVAVVICTFFCK